MKKGRKKSLRRVFYVWHYTIGLFASLFLLLLAITGILMNHSRSLGFEQVDMSFSWLLKWYGMEMSTEELAEIGQPIITLERVIIDAHNGTLFGIAGPFVMDLAALAVIFLIFTGIYNYIKIRKSK